MSLQQKVPSSGPTVFITEQDFEVLDQLATGARTPAGELLRGELDRAVVLDGYPAERPFVRLGSLVEYLELPSGRVRTVRLVRPQDADIDKGALSVLSHVGAALLGLSISDSFGLTTDNGRQSILVIIRIEEP